MDRISLLALQYWESIAIPTQERVTLMPKRSPIHANNNKVYIELNIISHSDRSLLAFRPGLQLNAFRNFYSRGQRLLHTVTLNLVPPKLCLSFQDIRSYRFKDTI